MVFEEHKLIQREAYPGEQTNQLRTELGKLERTITEQREVIIRIKDEKTQYGPSLNYTKDIKRLERHLKMLDKKIKACKDDDKLVRLLNCLGFIQGKKKEYTDDVMGIKRLLKGKTR